MAHKLLDCKKQLVYVVWRLSLLHLLQLCPIQRGSHLLNAALDLWYRVKWQLCTFCALFKQPRICWHFVPTRPESKKPTHNTFKLLGLILTITLCRVVGFTRIMLVCLFCLQISFYLLPTHCICYALVGEQLWWVGGHRPRLWWMTVVATQASKKTNQKKQLNQHKYEHLPAWFGSNWPDVGGPTTVGTRGLVAWNCDCPDKLVSNINKHIGVGQYPKKGAQSTLQPPHNGPVTIQHTLK